MTRILLEDSTEGGGGTAPQTAAQINAAQTGQVDITPVAPHAGAVIATATKSERERELESIIENTNAKLAATEKEKKDREQRINELEDARRGPAPAAKPKKVEKKHFLFRPSED